jgi:hypothetical protein
VSEKPAYEAADKALREAPRAGQKAVLDQHRTQRAPETTCACGWTGTWHDYLTHVGEVAIAALRAAPQEPESGVS